MDVHSHCVETFKDLVQRYVGEGWAALDLQNHNFPENPINIILLTRNTPSFWAMSLAFFIPPFLSPAFLVLLILQSCMQTLKVLLHKKKETAHSFQLKGKGNVLKDV